MDGLIRMCTSVHTPIARTFVHFRSRRRQAASLTWAPQRHRLQASASDLPGRPLRWCRLLFASPCRQLIKVFGWATPQDYIARCNRTSVRRHGRSLQPKRGVRLSRAAALQPILIICLGCSPESPQTFVKLGPTVFPAESFEISPEVPFDSSKQYVIKPENMTSFYDVPGEAGYFAFGRNYGFDSMSFVLTETHPRGGPPLHTHSVEEAHVLLSGSMDYVIGDVRFTATAPYIARVPANTPHTFMNSGDTPLNLIAVFPNTDPGYIPLGPNPIVPR